MIGLVVIRQIYKSTHIYMWHNGLLLNIKWVLQLKVQWGRRLFPNQKFPHIEVCILPWKGQKNSQHHSKTRGKGTFETFQKNHLLLAAGDFPKIKLFHKIQFFSSGDGFPYLYAEKDVSKSNGIRRDHLLSRLSGKLIPKITIIHQPGLHVGSNTHITFCAFLIVFVWFYWVFSNE